MAVALSPALLLASGHMAPPMRRSARMLSSEGARYQETSG